MDVFNLLISYGSSIQHNCVSSLKISNESDEELTKPTTLLFRLCNNDNIPGAKLKEAINNLSQAGYNFSRDNFLKKESHPAVNKLKEDNPFYKSLMKRMTRPVSLFLQCRRAVVKALGDPYRNKVQLLSNIAVPKLIIAFLQFSDLYCSCSAFIKGPLIWFHSELFRLHSLWRLLKWYWKITPIVSFSLYEFLSKWILN